MPADETTAPVSPAPVAPVSPAPVAPVSPAPVAPVSPAPVAPVSPAPVKTVETPKAPEAPRTVLLFLNRVNPRFVATRRVTVDSNEPIIVGNKQPSIGIQVPSKVTIEDLDVNDGIVFTNSFDFKVSDVDAVGNQKSVRVVSFEKGI